MVGLESTWLVDASADWAGSVLIVAAPPSSAPVVGEEHSFVSPIAGVCPIVTTRARRVMASARRSAQWTRSVAELRPGDPPGTTPGRTPAHRSPGAERGA
ncbi:hypothetical protein GCM10023108_25210 [Saccharopolyspora hordei]